MIFLVGSQRSGTNWLFQLLTLHPSVVGIEAETYLFALGFAPLLERFHHGSPASHQTGTIYMERSALTRAVRAFTDEVYLGVASRLDPAADRIVDRSPGHALHLDLIDEVYPDSWTVHIIRDGRDVARSLVGQVWGPASMREAADVWATAVTRARLHQPRRYKEVRYEELIHDPVTQMTQLFEWLGLTVTDDLLDAIRREATVPVNKNPGDVVGEGKWRGGLSADQAAEFDAVAGPLLRELGYPELPRPTAPGRSTLRKAAQRAYTSAHGALPRRHIKSEPGSPQLSKYMTFAKTGDRIIEVLESDQPHRIADMVSSDALITIKDRAGQRAGRGSSGAELLAEQWRATADERHRQLRADVHIHDDALTVVLTHQATDGVETHSMVVTQLRMSGSDATISKLTYYRLGHAG